VFFLAIAKSFTFFSHASKKSGDSLLEIVADFCIDQVQLLQWCIADAANLWKRRLGFWLKTT